MDLLRRSCRTPGISVQNLQAQHPAIGNAGAAELRAGKPLMPALTLSAAVILGHLATCAAVHPEVKAAPPRRVLAHAMGESGLSPFALHDNATGERQAYQTAAEAVATARKWLAQGHRIDAGIMQVTDSNWRALGLTVQTVFDPAANICAGARILADAFEIERRAACRYNSGQPVCTDYANIIDRAEARIDALPAAVAVISHAPVAPPPPARPPCAPAWDAMALAHCNARRAAAAYRAPEVSKATSDASIPLLAQGNTMR